MMPIKDPLETVPITFDFSDEIATASAPTVTTTVVSGTDVDAASMVHGAPIASGPVVTALIRAGVAGCNYRLRCVANGPSGEVLVRADILRVRTLPAVG